MGWLVLPLLNDNATQRYRQRFRRDHHPSRIVRDWPGRTFAPAARLAREASVAMAGAVVCAGSGDVVKQAIQAIVEVTIAQGGGDGFKPWGGCRVVLECGHTKQWYGGFPVPVPRVDDLFECKQCAS